ncbi:MFS drug efflux transporter, putative [Cordyceps militaris CM01]|uniref:MFS drug efflux transporter, putative n=1 Tax=Cordyceps militaris (strain CM01) TaxID=983644 RepID=G3JP56_CORMM|nr:MFS drug efflux transporter, putative [Cordyceps militaris CM01]EGX89666.1 MFS drug efflux transporter, putative [Cordyceps militaris CM01]
MVTKSNDSVPRSSLSQLQSAREMFPWKWKLAISAIFISKFLFALQMIILMSLPRGSFEELPSMQKLSWQHFAFPIGAVSASLVVGVSFGGVTYPWSSAQINASLCALGVLFSGSGFLQVYTVFISVARRVCPVEFFPSRTILIFFARAAAGGIAIFLPIYMTPLYFEVIRPDSASRSGVRLLPFIFVVIFAMGSNIALLARQALYMP